MSSRLILFVHGLGGDPHITWGNFPDLIRSDKDLQGYDVASFSYPTSLYRLPFSKKYPKIQALAKALRTEIETRFPDSDEIMLVCHSLGGLIARKYLIDQVMVHSRLRVRGLLLFAVPNNGAGLASVTKHISWRHNQLRQLCKRSDLIIDLNEDWSRLEVGKKLAIHYVVAALDRTVDEQSAQSFWGNSNLDVIPDRGHIDVVKPRDSQDLSYIILKRFALSCLGRTDKVINKYATPAGIRRAKKSPLSRFKVIAFDLDGTLLRGIDFSWTLVWKHLNFPKAVYKAGMQKYLRGEITYEEWCEWAVSQFRQRNLRRSDLRKLVEAVPLTKNFDEAIRILRNNGFVLAIISGGIDTFLKDKVDGADEIFDYICINKLSFDDAGVINGVEATPFDFAGKATALEAICKGCGATLAESVFVGEGFNDSEVAKRAGLSIAYPPQTLSVSAASRVELEEDNLMKILDHVL
jgi:HAD superfamily phosphoserine phosphatase-like hydrolase